MSEIFSIKAQVELCEALGLDPRKVQSLRLEMKGKNVPIMVVEQYVTDSQMHALAKVVQGFELHERWSIPGEPL